MSVQECARQIIDASAKRKRELVMTTRAKIGMWMKLIYPKLVDKTSLKTVKTGQ